MHTLEYCFHQPFTNLKHLFNQASEILKRNFNGKIFFYIPSMVRYETSYCKFNKQTFPAISVTGKKCFLNCDHCGGKLLESMIPVEKPDELYDILRKIYENGGKGCLISGGCNLEGYVPLETFLPIIAKAKREMDLEIVMHTGLIPLEMISVLIDTKVDAILLDIIGSELTFKKVYHLEKKIEELESLLKALNNKRLSVVPHIVVGIHYGKLLGELIALDLISRYKPAAVVIVAFMPIEGTKMANIQPPSPQEISRVMLAARLLLPSTPIVLGCARPRGNHRITADALAIKCGLNGIAYPTEAAFNICENLGYNMVIFDKCCSLIWKDITKLGHKV